MNEVIESGMLKGRPFGGVMIMIKNDLRRLTETVFCSSRYAIVRVANLLFINVYMPCNGTSNRLIISQDLLAEVWSWCEQFPRCHYIFAGDFNANLDGSDPISNLLNNMLFEHSLLRCDVLFSKVNIPTYVNTALGHQSTIDYVITSCRDVIDDFVILDPDINFSDHLPIMAICRYVDCGLTSASADCNRSNSSALPLHFRWDHADLIGYYRYTGLWLQPLLDNLRAVVNQYNNHEVIDVCSIIDTLYDSMVNVVATAASQFVPQRPKSFYKFGWDEEMDILKQSSIDSNKIWKNAGKPRQGPIFDKRQSCRLEYRRRLRAHQSQAQIVYSNELHDCLVKKNGPDFWKCWRAKFGKNSNNCEQVDGCVDNVDIVDKFVNSFCKAYSSNDAHRSAVLNEEYLKLRSNYCGLPLTNQNIFDVELLEAVLSKLKRGRAAGLDTLSAEHLLNSHPALPCFLSELFNLMLRTGHVPATFCNSYTVPIPKIQDCRTKAVTTDDFRGIAISPIISKAFEYCILERFSNFLKRLKINLVLKLELDVIMPFTLSVRSLKIT